MGLFDLFRKAKATPQDTPHPPLPVVCYRMAYFVLPQLLFNDSARFLGYFNNETYPAGPFLYVFACKSLNLEPNPDHARAFQTHIEELTPTQTCYLLEYPAPPPFDPTRFDDLNQTLAPYFSAVVLRLTDNHISYFTLGQNSVNATTLRSVSPDGMNANLGPGGAPNRDDFLALLRARVANK